MRVIVYKNLKRGDWSVAALKGAKGRGKVIDHRAAICLADVVFVVSEASRQTVVRKRERSVHAYAVGTVCEAPGALGERVTYNPYRSGSFTGEAGQPIAAAARVTFAADGKAYL